MLPLRDLQPNKIANVLPDSGMDAEALEGAGLVLVEGGWQRSTKEHDHRGVSLRYIVCPFDTGLVAQVAMLPQMLGASPVVVIHGVIIVVYANQAKTALLTHQDVLEMAFVTAPLVTFATLKALLSHRAKMVIAVAKEWTNRILNAERMTERAAPMMMSATLGAARAYRKVRHANLSTSATRATLNSRMSATSTVQCFITIAKNTTLVSCANSAASANARGPMVGNAQEVRNAHPIAARAQLGQRLASTRTTAAMTAV